MKAVLSTAPKTFHLPAFPDDEGALIRRLQSRRDADQLAYDLHDPVLRRIEQDTITLSRREDGALVLSGVTASTPLVIEADDAEGVVPQTSPTALSELAQARDTLAGADHATEEAERKRAVWQAHQARLPMAWACDTRVYEREDKSLFSKSTIVARSEAQFGNFALRPNAAALGRSVLVQRLYARGTYVAADVCVQGQPADKARYLAHLDCLLGPVGDQLERDYARLPSPFQTGREVVRWPAVGVTAVLLYGAYFAAAVGKGEVKTPEAESRGFHILHNILLGCCISYGVLALVVAAFSLRRRAEHEHIQSFRAIRQSHDRLLQTPSRTQEMVRGELQQSRDAVVRASRGWGRKHEEAVSEDTGQLPLRHIGQQALEEMQAYWGLGAGEEAV